VHVSAPTVGSLRVLLIEGVPSEIRRLLAVLRWLRPGSSFGSLVAAMVDHGLDEGAP
jgi:hypothetical protein